jgi:hypothetical protein
VVLQDDTYCAPDFEAKLLAAVAAVETKDPKFGLLCLYTGDRTGPPGPLLFPPTDEEHSNHHYGGPGQAVGLLYRREVVPGLARRIADTFDLMPVDWNIYGYLGASLKLSIYGTIPNLVQHVGTVSTRPGSVKHTRQRFTSHSFPWPVQL